MLQGIRCSAWMRNRFCSQQASPFTIKLAYNIR